MQSNLLNFIEKHDTWRELLKQPPYCIAVNEDEDYAIFNYRQYDSDFTLPLVKECRGIIINKHTMKIVCYPFIKFFNVQEPHAAQIDWNTAKVQEKIDGSIIKLWHDQQKWHVSTNGCIRAENAELKSDLLNEFSNYQELFDAATEKAGFDYDRLSPQCTYIFEIVSPFNRIVVPYNEIGLYHIGTRDMTTYEEIEMDIGVQKPKLHAFESLQDVIKNALELPYNQEGYVVVDAHYNRVKIKSLAYVTAHKIKGDGLTAGATIDLIRRNALDDFLSMFPEYTEKAHDLLQEYNKLVLEMQGHIDYILNRKWESRKDMAEHALKTRVPGCIFLAYDGKIGSAKEGIDQMPTDKIIQHFKCEI